MACHRSGDKPLPELMLTYCYVNRMNKFQWNLNQHSSIFIQENTFKNVVCESVGHFVLEGDELKTGKHYDDVIMTMLAFQITSLTVVYSIVYSGVNQRKHQSSASLAFVREIHRGPVNFPHKWPVTRKMFPFDDVIMEMTSSGPDALPSPKYTNALDK